MSGSETTRDLGSSLPVMQAAIGRVGDSRLVLGVGAAGGVGTVGASYMPLDLLHEQLSVIEAGSVEPFVVNLILAFDQRARLRAALEHAVPWVSFSWGLDPALVEQVHAAGASVLVQVTSEDEAAAALSAGADSLIVQGVEAGGHVQATDSLTVALPAIRQMTDRVLVAAGGICGRRAAVAARNLGADVVSLGTRFAACSDSLAHARYREALLAASGEDTVLTGLFNIGWAAPHRVLRTRIVEQWEDAGRPSPGSRPGEGTARVTGPGGALPLYSMHPAVHTLTGNVETLPFYAGMDVGSITASESAFDVVVDIAATVC